MTAENDEQPLLNRTRKRLLRRMFNGRQVPVIADHRSFMTYKEAVRYLESLTMEAREAAYEEMKAHAKAESL
jgi:hypothetical protein